VAHFTTSTVPSVRTLAAQGVTATSATLAGAVNPDGLLTSYYFQYGGTSAYGHQTPTAEAGAGTIEAKRTTLVSGLEPGRTYHYRIVATNNGGTPQIAYGQDETFTTPATPPVLSGISVTGVTQNAATITATLNPQGFPTRYELQVGATPGLLRLQASANTISTTPIPLSIAAGPLTSGTVYYYKLIATNPDGISELEGSFITAPASAAAVVSSTLTIVPFHTIAELDAKEAKEDKPAKPLTNHEKLVKALKACKKKKNKHKRIACEKQAHQKYGPKKKKN
jgi:hypothetical protein